MRICFNCKKEKPETIEFFELRKDTGKFRGECKECVKEKQKVKWKNYYSVEENRQKHLSNSMRPNQIERRKNYYYLPGNKEKAANRNKTYRHNTEWLENKKLKDQEYYENNKIALLKQAKEYREKNKEQISIKKKEHYQNNLEKHKKRLREYYIKNKEQILEYQKVRRGPPSFLYDSKFEEDIANFLKENNIKFESHNNLIGLELDFYLPEYNLAIEANGIYWHSDVNDNDQNKFRHNLKLQLCEDKNIQLLQIFEDEWMNKKDIWKNLIFSKCGIFKKRLYARKCIVKEINNNETNIFLEENHLQGSYSGKNLGLYHNDELISLITYGQSRFENDVIELYRFATKLNTQVVGGFGKLIKTANVPMVTFADRRYSNGKTYEKFGNFIGVSEPNYWYVKNKNKLPRYKAMKHKLPKLLGENFDPNLTEKENMFKNGWRILYDCGNLKYQL